MDFKEIKELIRVFDKSELNKLKVKDENFEIALQKGFEGGTVVTTAPVAAAAPVAVLAAPAAAPLSSNVEENLGDTIDAPMIGTFYASPSPEASNFVKVGDTVSKGQTLCILEAMKIMNEVEAEFDCKIVKILVEDGNPVEYDMPLFVVEKL
ncbi:MAG: acetyl-CoA carboxylase biotin carboxyl carrier protein [Campylobacteraceae bacterium]|nr:acetyl-CoA carboxylase biotin carboxyl carrier protein [Campylobacteraceae bacterium]